MTANPFAKFNTETHRVKLWNTFVPALPNGIIRNGEVILTSEPFGRVKFAALVPKKPHDLIDILWVAAWCSPEDFKKFKHKTANNILVGRLEKALATNDLVKPNSATQGYLDAPDLKPDNIFANIFVSIAENGYLPFWVDVEELFPPSLESSSEEADLYPEDQPQ